MTRTAKLALEDGTVFTGRSFGAEGERTGEVVFNTALRQKIDSATVRAT